ncbi:phospholipase D, partial [Rhizodiscina lignyota]
QRLMSKLKALATPIGHGRSMSAWTIGSAHDGMASSTAQTPASERGEPGFIMEDSEADADAEESGAEGTEGASDSARRPPRKRRKSRRMEGGTQTAPTTPRSMKLPSFMRDSSPISPASTTYRPGFMRRATMNEIPEHHRSGVSEDEGRDRMARSFRTMAGARGLSYSGGRRAGDGNATDRRKPSNLRRITGLVGGRDAEGSQLILRQRGDRSSTYGVQKWQQLKSGLKTFMQREKLRIDHAKSAELMAELLAGAPAALFLASMFQRDEHGNRRIPVLLEQLKVRIKENRKIGDRHHIFKIELEYGNGLTRMKWVVHRSLREFITLNAAYSTKQFNQTYLRFKNSGRAKKPHFPTSVFPFLRGARGLLGFDVSDDDDEETVMENAAENTAEGEQSGTERPAPDRRRRSSFGFARHKSGVYNPRGPGATRLGSSAGLTQEERDRNYSELQRKALEEYLQKMVTAFMFRADSNRLCKFLELSALGIRLGAEGGYHGKEGLLMIRSGKGMDFRRSWQPQLFKERHSPKWFLVRHSYIVCVNAPEEMNIYDVILLDAEFTIEKKTDKRPDEQPQDLAKRQSKNAAARAAHPQYHHQLRIQNTERTVKLLGRSKELINQFEQSILFMMQTSIWSQRHRFNSFAPVRKNVFARWLVDGRDYMWQVSKAISRATDVIYIHDWWLSPELYLRRPAAISQKWRLDRLLQRKAREGVKIFVIMYRNINSAIPIDSEYSKFSLLDLHPNVFVQRSPNQFRQNTFFWSHHEKICVIDHNVAFCGGVDLCFGRWDTPGHTLVDDKMTGFELSSDPKDADHCQLWPGKDYSNPRVQDFYSLDKPYEEMYDRSRIPRMPWHDIGMQIVGQPARDLTRHFVQRWNYILRQRNPSRPTPFLLPAPDFTHEDLEALDMDGTCEIQMLRSACEWSLGIGKPEHSIMNAYVKLIEESDHFVYIENQFFITSCSVEGTKIENLIGDALVDRIIRAHRDEQEWRAIIVIPLMPGYQNTVDSADGSSVRLIMTCQYRSICRGETSIFERLRAAGIEPEDYIQFYALRQWGKIGPTQTLVTEQLYIHAKIMVVDDRVAIIGSANINERSLLGSRDSEVAAIIRDTDLMDSQMAGEPYKVGRFPHTLRMRLMREHLGLDVDVIAEEERIAEEESARASVNDEHESHHLEPSPIADKTTELHLIESHHRLQDDLITRAEELHSYNHDTDSPQPKGHKKQTSDPRVMNNPAHERDVMGAGPDNMLNLAAKAEIAHGRDSRMVNGHEYLVNSTAPEDSRATSSQPSPKQRSVSEPKESHSETPLTNGEPPLPPPRVPRMDTAGLGLPLLSSLPVLPTMDDTDIGAPPLQRAFSRLSAEIIAPLIAEMRRPIISRDCMRDPLTESFYLDTWHQIAENNTRIFRHVFRCQPDNEAKTWKEYREFSAYGERFSQSQGAGKSKMAAAQAAPGGTGPPGHGTAGPLAKAGEVIMKVIPGTSTKENQQMGKVEEWGAEQEHRAERSATPDKKENGEELNEKSSPNLSGKGTVDSANPITRNRTVTISEPTTMNSKGSTRRQRRRGTTKSSMRAFQANDETLLEKDDAEELLKMVQGVLVVWPYDWLEKEERNAGWLYAVDQLAPLEI